MSRTLKMLENCHKVVFLAKQYPKHTISQLIALMPSLPPIEINAAFWYAEREGYLTKPDKDGKIELLRTPDAWEFGNEVEDLRDHLVFAMSVLAGRQHDMTEEEISEWCFGYAPHDLAVALKSLLDENAIATYDLVDPKDLKSTYTFFTLYENGEQLWGRSRFKEQPTGEEKPETDEQPNSGEGAAEQEKK
jgi:hypothetical protein